MYQLYAYAKKYHCNELYLIYPKNENFTESLASFKYEEDIILKAIPYDLENDECILFD
jgi:5-methylcytosine-specific restriction enzyme subunit McrC